MRAIVLFAILLLPLFAADFTTYIGDANQYQVAAIATDSAGDTFVTGSRLIQIGTQSASDVFVTKLNPMGEIVFTTTFGGKGIDQGNAIALDPAGNIWVSGSTSSTNFPLRDALQTALGGANPGGQTGFLVKLAPDGTVIYSSYFGGLLGLSSVNGLATDASGNVYLTGSTNSGDFPTTAGLPAAQVRSGLAGVSGAFITKLDSSGSQVLYSALIAGNAVDCAAGSTCFLSQRYTSGVGIAVDADGTAFVAGNTNTTDLPVTAGLVSGYGAFAVAINSEGNQVGYLTYVGPPSGPLTVYGPTQTITASAIAIDSGGNVYLTGYTNDPLFPATPGAYQTALSGNAGQSTFSSDAFAVKLNPTGTIVWATYLGGPGNDAANSISVDSSDDVWLAGNNAAGFPSTSPGFVSTAGDFVAELSVDGSQLLYSAEYPSGGAGQAIAIDQNGLLHLSGATGLVSTLAPGQPVSSRIFGIVNAAAGQLSGRIAPGEVISIFGAGVGPVTPATATPNSAGLFPTTLGGVQVLVNGAAIPLLYVSASQINAEIPLPLAGVTNGSAIVGVVNGSATLPDFRVAVDSAIFAFFLNSDGTIAAINQDGTLNSASNPALAGTFVSVWATGFVASPQTVNGAVATAANNWCAYCQISVGGTNETVSYAGSAPGVIDGVMQINFMIPTAFDLYSSAFEVDLNFNGFGSSGLLWVGP